MTAPFLSESRSLRYGVFFLLYVRQGLPAGFASTALANFLTKRGASPEAVGAFVAWTGLPWTLQFVWGPLLDRFQGSAMGRRRPWVLGAQLLGVAATLPLIAVRDPVAEMGWIAWIFLIHSVVASVQDTGVDAMAISVAPDRERGRVNACMRGGFLVGMGAGALLTLPMSALGFRFAATLQTLALAAFAALTFLVRERPGDALLPGGRAARSGAPDGGGPGPTGPAIVADLWRGLLSRPSLALFSAVAVAYLSASVFIRTISIHLIRDGGWGDDELSVFTGTVGMLLALAVVGVGGLLSDRIGHRRLLTRVMLAVGAYLIGFAALAPLWGYRPLTRSALAVWYTFDPILSVAAMPALMALCRPGVEGSQFTAYMALVNLCDVAGSYLAGLALGVAGAPAITAACGLAVLAASASLLGRRVAAPPVAADGPSPPFLSDPRSTQV